MNVRAFAAAALAIAVSLPLAAQAPYLVADLNTTSSEGQRSSNPGNFQVLGGTLYFSAQDGQGNELWKYSGGVASRVADIRSGAVGSFPFGLTDIGGGVYLFRANGGPQGYELWRTDGTAAGTSLVKDIHPTTDGLSAWQRRAVLNGRAFFMANDGVNGSEPWVSDGTAAGTQLLLDLNNAGTSSNPTMFVPLNGKMLIFGANGLWSSDGTTLGTTLVASVGVAWGQGRIGNTLYFTATGMNAATGRELWKTDGTAAGTQPVADVVPGTTSGLLTNSLLVPIGTTLYFTAYHPGGGVDLWKSDGSAAGTQFVRTLSTDANANAWSMFAIGSLLLIEAGDEIWRSDGTAAGTYVLDSGHAARGLVQAFGRGYYFREGTVTDELWSTDGAATQFVAVADSGLQLTSTGGKLYFSASENLFGQEPWVSEAGTTATTHRLANVNPDLPPSSVPDKLTVVNDLVFFHAWDGFVPQREIWRSNGTSSGTFRVTSLLGSGGSYLGLLTGWNGGLYFLKNSELWRSDGTVPGTAMLKDMTASPVISMFPGSRYLFLGLNPYGDPTLGRTDGTAAGTIRLGDLLLYNHRPAEPFGYTELAGRTFVTGNEHARTEGAWVTDGTPETTSRVVGEEPRVVNVKPAAAAGAYFFVASTAATGHELWRSDGIGGSEMLVKDIVSGEESSYPADLTAAGRYLYFVATDTVHGRELWRTDGTSAGTILLGDIAAGGPSGTPANLTAAGELLYFTANDGSHGVELWRTDGTPGGTVMVSDLFPGTSSADPGHLRFAEGTLWFAADNGVAGRELWRVTGAGLPSMVADLEPGAEPSHPTEMVQAGQLLYFAANTSAAGRELWALPLTASSLRIDDARIVEGTGGTRTLRFTVTRTGNTSGAASAAFTTVNGSATSGADYAAQSGIVAFTAGQTSRFIDVIVQSDAAVEENEGFFVTLTSPSGATMARGMATGVIDDDDHRAELSIVPIPSAIYPWERRFRITNAGPSAANDVRVRYSESPGHLELELNYQCSSEENPITCNFGTLAAGASLEVFVHGQWIGGGMTDQETRPGSTVTATVSATEPDSNPADNSVARMIGGGTRITTLPYLTSGTTSTAEVSLDYDHSTEPITATLTSSVAAVSITPSSVIIPPGQKVATFTITVAGNYTGPVKLTSTPLTYGGSFMTIQVVAPGQVPKLASAMGFDHQSAIYGNPVLLPVTVAARRHDGTKPTGLVSLLNQQGDVVLQQQQLDPAGKTVFEIEDLQPGNRLFLLRYHGDANFEPLQYGSVAVSVKGWPTTVLMDTPPMLCAGATSEIYIDVETTATTNPPTGSIEVTVGNTVVATLPLSPTGTPGLSRAILRRAFAAGEAFLSVQYVPAGTFEQSWHFGHFQTHPCTPMNVQATGTSSSTVAVNWTPVAGAVQYEVIRVNNWWTPVGTTTSTAFVDDDHSMVKSYLYTVRAINSSGQTIGWGAPDLALPMLFADDPLAANVTAIRGVHEQQVRAGINGMRYMNVNIGDVDDVPPTPAGTIVSAASIMALREEITDLRRGLGLPQFVFTDPALTAGMPMKAVHMQELRDAVR